MARFYVYTLGCKVNQIESDSIVEQFIEAGFDFAEQSCDIAVINGCAVTRMAESKSRQLIARIRKVAPLAKIIFAGCAAEKIATDDPGQRGFDFVAGNKYKNKLPEIARSLLDNAEVTAEPSALTSFQEYVFDNYPKSRTRAFIKIQDGCENYCSYCIIPFLRGPLRSRNMDSIAAELDKIAAAGFREVVLTGIHLGNYGKEQGFSSRLEDVVDIALRHSAQFRVRLGSVESPEISDRLLELFENERLCRHLHLPLQSGCDTVLTRMNRNYSTAQYRRLLEKITNRYSDIAVTADVITGFPGETEREHCDTLEFVRNSDLAGLHVFPFSRRSGTAAWSMPGQLPASIRKQRARELVALGSGLRTTFIARQKGRKQQVLVEGSQDGYDYGYTSNYLKCWLKTSAGPGKVVEIMAGAAFRDGLIAVD